MNAVWSLDAQARRPAGAELTLQPMAAAGLRAFERIAQAWGLSVDEQLVLLGQPPRSTFFAWRKQPDKASVPRDTLERLSNLLGIWKSLQMLLPDPAAAVVDDGFGGRNSVIVVGPKGVVRS